MDFNADAERAILERFYNSEYSSIPDMIESNDVQVPMHRGKEVCLFWALKGACRTACPCKEQHINYGPSTIKKIHAFLTKCGVPKGGKKKARWNTSMAKQCMVQDMLDGTVPTNEAIVDPHKLYFEFYADHPYFKDFPYKDGVDWEKRIRSAQQEVFKYQSHAKTDKEALDHDRQIHPVPTHYPNGKPLWRNSLADAVLDLDMANGEHLRKKPQELLASRPNIYFPFGSSRLRRRIRQKLHDVKEYGEKRPQQLGQEGEHLDRIKYFNGRPCGLKGESRKTLLDPYVNEIDESSPPPPIARCEAIQKNGFRCQATGDTVKDGACGRKSHQLQVARRRAGLEEEKDSIKVGPRCEAIQKNGFRCQATGDTVKDGACGRKSHQIQVARRRAGS